jgi:lysozyme family protein
LDHEGGFVNDPDDPGGATNKGITFSTFEKHAKGVLGLEPTLTNLKELTNSQAKVIYKSRYWNKMRGDDFTHQDLANIVFDFFVNAGYNGTKVLQEVLNSMGEKLAVDGIVGPNTIKVLNSKKQVEVYRKFKQARIDYYEKLAAKNSKMKKFLKGWLNRVNSFPEL